jgi:hypothetical protein
VVTAQQLKWIYTDATIDTALKQELRREYEHLINDAEPYGVFPIISDHTTRIFEALSTSPVEGEPDDLSYD